MCTAHTAQDHRKLADPGGERIPNSLEEQQEEQHVEDGASDEPYEPISVNLCTKHNTNSFTYQILKNDIGIHMYYASNTKLVQLIACVSQPIIRPSTRLFGGGKAKESGNVKH